MLLSADNCSDIPSLSPRLLPETRRSGGRWLHRSAGEGPGGQAGQEGQPGKHGGSLGAAEGALGAGPPGPESGWLEGSGKHTAPMGGRWIGAGGNRAGPSAARRVGESQARGHLGRRGRVLSGAPSQGMTRWLLTVRAPGSSWRPGRLVSHPCSEHPPPPPALSQHLGPGPPGRTPVIQGVPSAPPVPQPQTVWDTLTPDRPPPPPPDLGVCGGQGSPRLLYLRSPSRIQVPSGRAPGTSRPQLQQRRPPPAHLRAMRAASHPSQAGTARPGDREVTPGPGLSQMNQRGRSCLWMLLAKVRQSRLWSDEAPALKGSAGPGPSRALSWKHVPLASGKERPSRGGGNWRGALADE